MADFDPAHHKTGIHEGGYSNHKDDSGKETIFGIARAFHPKWDGWPTVDSYKIDGVIPSSSLVEFVRNEDLKESAKQYYKKKFWRRYRLNLVDSQPIAEILYDIKVNGGNPWMMLQRTINVLNNKGKDWQDIDADGMIGPTTVRVLNDACKFTRSSRGKYQSEVLILDDMLSLRDSYFTEISERKEKNESFTSGWKTRVMKQRIEYYIAYGLING